MGPKKTLSFHLKVRKIRGRKKERDEKRKCRPTYDYNQVKGKRGRKVQRKKGGKGKCLILRRDSGNVYHHIYRIAEEEKYRHSVNVGTSTAQKKLICNQPSCKSELNAVKQQRRRGWASNPVISGKGNCS